MKLMPKKQCHGCDNQIQYHIQAFDLTSKQHMNLYICFALHSCGNKFSIKSYHNCKHQIKKNFNMKMSRTNK